MEGLFTTEALISFITLALMEIVLGIDNIVFISILTAKLPEAQQPKARNLGLTLALVIRLGLLFTIKWIMGLTATLFTINLELFKFKLDVTGQRIILLIGGLFLIGKSTHEIYEKLEGAHGSEGKGGSAASFGLILVQILLLDIVFSLDSVITAVGMAKDFRIMAAAMVTAVIVMLVFAGAVGSFVNRHPSMKILALSFLLLIGVMLMVEGAGGHVSKGYIYSAMAFSLLVEVLNMRFRKKQAPVHLHGPEEQPHKVIKPAEPTA
ncbi:MAG: TerC family protein [Planctomycetota bacterium]|nr:MAG: TerC family protein [Planctomycetota bacterium]